MSLYNMIFGKNPHANDLLGLLGLNQSDFYRFRDCFLYEDDETKERYIAVYTRGGGGNRECWDDDCCVDGNHAEDCVITIQNRNRQHLLYSHDEDDDFDYTYATFYFKLPNEADLGHIESELDRDTAWKIVLDLMKGQ